MLEASTAMAWSVLGPLESPGALPTVAALLGLLVGSFLNTVIHRLPRMLEREWRAQCAELDGRQASPSERYDLSAPRSHCETCRTPIRLQHLVPLVGWAVLRGRCAACGARIPLRYPLIELLTAALFCAAALRFGLTSEFVAAVIVSGFLLTLAFIDIDTHYLPDQLTLPMLWIGLAVSLAGDVAHAVLGAIMGYLILWIVYHLFKLLTGKEGMGYGDFKLLAALGAWLGPGALLPIVLASSIVGAAVGLALISLKGRSCELPFAFGPYLAAAGWAVMMAGDVLPGGFLFGS